MRGVDYKFEIIDEYGGPSQMPTTMPTSIMAPNMTTTLMGVPVKNRPRAVPQAASGTEARITSG